MSNLFSPLPFKLKLKEIISVNKMKNKKVGTNWCQEGKMQEKGQETEKLVNDLLLFCEDTKVRRSEKQSVLDEVFKIDFILESISNPLDVFAFQVKSSLTGAIEHHLKNGEQIVWEESCIRTPWVLIIDGSLSNLEMFLEITNELDLPFAVDFEKLEDIRDKVMSDNNKRRSLTEIECIFGKLSKLELTGLRLFYNIGRMKKVLYFKNK